MIKLQKAIIRTGVFNHPDGKGTFTITRERLEHWVNTFNDMWQKKVNVPVVVDHLVDTFHTVGRVTGLKREGDYLMASLEFPTREYAELTKVNDVSIGSKDILITGVKTYRDGLEHVSLTPRPVVPNLGGYTLLCSLRDYAGKESRMETIVKILDAVAAFMGLEVPEEAKVNEEAAYTFITTVLNCASKVGGEEPPKEDEPKDKPTDDEESKNEPKDDDKPKTPGEDEIVASLNNARSIQLRSLMGRGGVNASLIEGLEKEHCQHKTLKGFTSSIPVFGALFQGLQCSLGDKPNILKTSSGTQTNPPNHENKKSLFQQRAEQRAKQKA